MHVSVKLLILSSLSYLKAIIFGIKYLHKSWRQYSTAFSMKDLPSTIFSATRAYRARTVQKELGYNDFDFAACFENS